MIKRFTLIAIATALVGCTSSPAPRLSPSQQAEQDRRYDVVGDSIVASLTSAGGCQSKDQIQQMVGGQTSSRQEALVVSLISTRRLSEQGKVVVHENSVSLPGKGACA